MSESIFAQLLDAEESLAASSALDGLADELACAALAHCDADGSCLALVDDAGMLGIRAQCGRVSSFAADPAWEATLLSVMEGGQPLSLADGSALYLPLGSRAQPFGVLGLLFDGRAVWQPSAEMTAFASQAALAIENALLRDALVQQATAHRAALVQASQRVQAEIAEQQRVEQQLRKLSRAVEQSANTIMITDLDGRIEYVNPKFTALTGYTVEEAIDQRPSLLKSGLTPPERYTAMWQAIQSGSEWRGEFINRKKNGELYWELASISRSAARQARSRITSPSKKTSPTSSAPRSPSGSSASSLRRCATRLLC